MQLVCITFYIRYNCQLYFFKSFIIHESFPAIFNFYLLLYLVKCPWNTSAESLPISWMKSSSNPISTYQVINFSFYKYFLLYFKLGSIMLNLLEHLHFNLNLFQKFFRQRTWQCAVFWCENCVHLSKYEYLIAAWSNRKHLIRLCQRNGVSLF